MIEREDEQLLWRCDDYIKSIVQRDAATYTLSVLGSEEIDTLPLTDSDLTLSSRITDEELLRFAMPVSILGRLRRTNKGGKGIKIGDREVSCLRGQGIELMNLGEAGRVKRGEIGHWICSVCGATKTPYAVDAEINHFLKTHTESCGKEPKRLALTVKAEVDCLQFQQLEDEATAINIGASLMVGAVRVLDMGSSDLESLVIQRPAARVPALHCRSVG